MSESVEQLLCTDLGLESPMPCPLVEERPMSSDASEKKKTLPRRLLLGCPHTQSPRRGQKAQQEEHTARTSEKKKKKRGRSHREELSDRRCFRQRSPDDAREDRRQRDRERERVTDTRQEKDSLMR